MERAPAFGQGNGNGMGPDAGSLVSHGPASGLHGSPRVNEPAAAEGLPAPPQIEPLVLSTETIVAGGRKRDAYLHGTARPSIG